MSIRGILAFSALGVTALGMAGCAPHHHHHAHQGRPMTVGAELTCPESEGVLTRVSAASDGQSCVYRRDDGEQVTLTRLPLSGQTPQAALAPIEASLKTLVPPRNDAAPSGSGKSDSDDGDNAHIDVPGVHIDAHGDKAEVRVLGMTIDADNDKANIHAGVGSDKAVILADDNGAEVRATDIDASNAKLVLVLASEKPGPTGLRAVGYMARGPVSGPLVVAQFQSADRHSRLNDDHDVNRLLDMNVSR